MDMMADIVSKLPWIDWLIVFEEKDDGRGLIRVAGGARPQANL